MKLVDLTGQKFGKFTVISRSHTAENGQILWLCRCECGREKKVLGASLKDGSTKTCGCETGRFADETGKRYGRLTVIGRRYPNQKRGAYWICRCDCGNEIVTSGNCLRSGNSSSCGCLRIDRTREVASKPEGVAATNRAIRNMQDNARRRNIPWALSDEQVISLMQQNCHYCGSSPMHLSKAKNGNYLYNGLDRVDNNQGYTIENIVPCCIVCNNAKRTMSLEDFLAWVERVYKHSIDPTR